MLRRAPRRRLNAYGRASPWPQARPYARRAIQEALEGGFTAEELDGVLGELDPTELVPPYRDEDVPGYARRAAGEIMVRYLRS
jgi:hypothetical protein